MSETMPFGDLMRRHRRALDLTQQQLAERVGCATTTIVKFENETRRPSREMALRLVEILEVPPAQRAAFLQVARRSQRRAAQVSAPPTSGPHPHPRPSMPPLPSPALPLIGRDGEMAVLKELFTRPECRLVTIVGPGGIGKSRLALQVAAELAPRFADGAAFVALAPLASADSLPAAIAEATGCAFQDTGDVVAQLVMHLRPRHMLVILDSIEHLLDDEKAADLAAALLEKAPGLALLATSRERLNLRSEWVFELQGLSAPPALLDGAAEALIETYPSAGLFLQHARRLRPGFTATPGESAAIARICRAVEGLPLAIELSAAWTPTLSCAEIADEIQLGIDFLNASVRDLPPRHRSMRAVFDHSWRLLSPGEQRVMRRLAVFHGSFTRRAAEIVAGASLNQLSSLVAKSLVRRTPEGRYDLHELIGHYSASQLRASDDEAAASRAHAEYYLALAADYQKILQSAEQRQALADLQPDLDNLRSAWRWAAAHGLVQPMQQAAWAFWYFLDLRNLYRDVAESFQHAEEALQALKTANHAQDPSLDETIGQMRTWRGFAGFRLGQVSEGRSLLEESIPVLRRSRSEDALVDALWVYGLLSWLSGEFSAAGNVLQESLALSEALALPWQLTFVPLVLGAVRHDQGAYDEAYRLLRDGLDRCLVQGIPRNTAFALGLLARTVRVLGYNDDLQVLMAEHLRLATEMDDRSAMAFVMENMALAIQSGDDPEAARRYFQEAVDHYADLGDLWSASRTLCYAGQFELSQGDTAQAQDKFQRALQTAVAGQSDTNVLDALAGLAEAQARQDRSGLACALAGTVLQHPASSQAARDRARQILAELAGHCGDPPQVEASPLEEAIATALKG